MNKHTTTIKTVLLTATSIARLGLAPKGEYSVTWYATDKLGGLHLSTSGRLMLGQIDSAGNVADTN
jgi:hypothetical protein